MNHNVIKMLNSVCIAQVKKLDFIYVEKAVVNYNFLNFLRQEGFIYGYTFCSLNKKIKVFLKYKDTRPLIFNRFLIKYSQYKIIRNSKALFLDIYNYKNKNKYTILSTDSGYKHINFFNKQGGNVILSISDYKN